MRRILLFLILQISIFNYLLSQDSIWDKTSYKKEKVTIMLIENDQGSNNVSTVQGFPIQKSYDLTNKEVREILKILYDESEYILDNSRSCAFVANYAIIIKSEKSEFNVIVSKDVCPKLIIYDLKSESPIYVDLIKNCSLYKFIDECLN